MCCINFSFRGDDGRLMLHTAPAVLIAGKRALGASKVKVLGYAASPSCP